VIVCGKAYTAAHGTQNIYLSVKRISRYAGLSFSRADRRTGYSIGSIFNKQAMTEGCGSFRVFAAMIWTTTVLIISGRTP
jgi:hypothetical protein